MQDVVANIYCLVFFCYVIATQKCELPLVILKGILDSSLYVICYFKALSNTRYLQWERLGKGYTLYILIMQISSAGGRV